jgi:hypothetical protein
MLLSSFDLSWNTYYFLTEGVSLEFDIFESNLINLVILGGLIVHRIFFPAYKGFSKREEFTKLAFLESIRAEEELRLLLVEAYCEVFLKHTFLLISRDFAYVRYKLGGRCSNFKNRKGNLVGGENLELRVKIPEFVPGSGRDNKGVKLNGSQPFYKVSQLWPLFSFLFPFYSPRGDLSFYELSTPDRRKEEYLKLSRTRAPFDENSQPGNFEERCEYASPLRASENYLHYKRVECMRRFCSMRNVRLKDNTLSMQYLFIEDFKRLMLSLEASKMKEMEVKLLLEGASKDFGPIQDVLERLDEVDPGDFVTAYT